MSYKTPITDADLHAFLDGQLSDARRLQVEAWLKEHPDKLRELNEYQAIDRELHRLLDPIVQEPIPDALRIPPRKRLYKRLSLAASFLLAGVLIGWNSHGLFTTESRLLQVNLSKPAAFAHVVYAAEKRHPVEVGADQEQHLIDWLSKRLKTRIKAPNLAQHGYQLVGGRLLPSTDRMAAQFMYQDKSGTRVTLYVRRINNIKADTMFQFTQDKQLNTFYWIEGTLGYALSGELNKDVLMAMARTSYQQLNLNI